MRRVIVVGRARDALAEYEAARSLCSFDDVLVVGAVVMIFPHPVDHLVSFHAELFDFWAEKRAAAGLPPVAHYWGGRYKSRNLGEKTTRCRPLTFVASRGGSSGFLATDGVALGALRADRVVLAGVPMRSEDAHAQDDKPWAEADQYWPTWQRHLPELLGRVRSMSGRTRDLLGEPTREWLDEVS